MHQYFLHKMIAALVVVALCTTSFSLSGGATATAAPAAQDELRAQEVTGTLPGGQFAKIWLGLVPETSGAQITIVSEWDIPNPSDKGLNFFILDEQGLRSVGDDSLSSIALGAGSTDFVLNSPDNALGASFNAVGLADYTVVVANDSNQDANFTLRVTNGFIVDDSGQVTDPNAPATTDDDAADEDATDEDATDEDATDEADASDDAAATTDATTAVTTTVTTPDPVAEAVTEAVTTTETASTDAVQESTMVATGPVRTDSLSGSLPEQDDQHFLGLEPNGRDVQVTLRLTFEPQDNSELARRLNFWVLDPTGFNQFLGGSDPSDVAIAAGNRVFRGQDNERVASFRVAGTGSYTVIVYNNATVPATYALSIENGLLIDDAGQTNEAMVADTTLDATGTTTDTVDADTTATTTDTVATDNATTPAATTTTTRTGTPGGSYTVQSGDTLALIARDIYGDLNLYEELCAFNNISNCNVIEVGDVLQLPTRAQIASGATAPAASTTATAERTTTTTAETTAPATTTADDTAAEDDASTEQADEDAPAVDATEAVTETATDDDAAAGGDTIFQTLVGNGNFTTLVKGLEETGLDGTLDSGGDLTLFAPTDAAFVALRNRFNLTEDQLLGLPELADTLRYHVLDGSVLSNSLADGDSATTLQGSDVSFAVSGDSIAINGATLIATDVETANGVIHVIEAVIIPPAE